MRWELVKKIGNFYNYSYFDWGRAIELGYLIYCPRDVGIVIRDASTFDILFKTSKFEKNNINYYVHGKEVFFSIDNYLMKFDISRFALTEICKTEEASMGMLNKDYCVGRTTSRRPRINRSEIKKITDCQTVYKWEGRSFVVYSKGGLFLFEDYTNGTIKRIDVESGADLWKFTFSRPFPGTRYYQDVEGKILLTIEEYDYEQLIDKKYALLGLELETGKLKFRSRENHFCSYLYDQKREKLFGIEGSTYRCVEPYTGKTLSELEVQELKGHHVSGRQSMKEGKIYFSTYGADIGCFNVETEKLEYFHTVDLNESKVDMRRPLGVPLVNDNKLFIRDSSGVLHIYKKSDNNMRLQKSENS